MEAHNNNKSYLHFPLLSFYLTCPNIWSHIFNFIRIKGNETFWQLDIPTYTITLIKDHNLVTKQLKTPYSIAPIVRLIMGKELSWEMEYSYTV